MTENPAVQLEEMIRTAVRDEMGPDSSGELDAMTLGALLIQYLNWTDRRVGRRPRRAHLSTSLTDSQSYRVRRPGDSVAGLPTAGGPLSAGSRSGIERIEGIQARLGRRSDAEENQGGE